VIERLSQLEARFERLFQENQDLRRKLTIALQQIRDLQAKPSGGGGNTGTVYFTDPVVIAAGGSESGLTIKKKAGGSTVTVSDSGTVYNEAAVATSGGTGQTIFLGANGDGTYLAISQSCPPAEE